MSSEINETMSILNEHLAVKDEKGRVVLQVALIATVYFERQYARDVREAVVSCCEDYFQRCGEHLRWAVNPDTFYMDPFGRGKASAPRSWLAEKGDDDELALICHGAERLDGASAFSVYSFCGERYPYETLGYFRVSFPLLWFAENPGSLPDVLLSLCRKLRPTSGYGGIGVINSPSTTIRSIWEPVVYAWAQRLPGLEADYPIAHELWLSKGRDGKGGIKGVNWLTVVGDRWLAELGGADAVAAAVAPLDSRFTIHRFDGGLMIQAGQRPNLGNAERNAWPELYVKLSKYLKPIRITKTRPFAMGGPGPRFDLERSEAWLRRFDDR